MTRERLQYMMMMVGIFGLALCIMLAIGPGGFQLGEFLYSSLLFGIGGAVGFAVQLLMAWFKNRS